MSWRISQGIGRTIGLEDRRNLADSIETAYRDGTRLHKDCEIGGIDVRTLQRWKAGDGLQSSDRRPLAERPVPAKAFEPAGA